MAVRQQIRAPATRSSSLLHCSRQAGSSATSLQQQQQQQQQHTLHMPAHEIWAGMCSRQRLAALQFIWGGRNNTAYFEDGWSFSLSNHSWTELHADPAVHQPRARDHLGAFYHAGSVWIYGACPPGVCASPQHAVRSLWGFVFPADIYTCGTGSGCGADVCLGPYSGAMSRGWPDVPIMTLEALPTLGRVGGLHMDPFPMSLGCCCF